jgi:hypothetical protein
MPEEVARLLAAISGDSAAGLRLRLWSWDAPTLQPPTRDGFPTVRRMLPTRNPDQCAKRIESRVSKFGNHMNDAQQD